jgi:hypothetical protein
MTQRELSGPEISLCGFPDPFQRMYETVHRDWELKKSAQLGLGSWAKWS